MEMLIKRHIYSFRGNNHKLTTFFEVFVLRIIVNEEVINGNSDFWLYFFASNYPNAFDAETNMTLTELIEEKYTISKSISNYKGFCMALCTSEIWPKHPGFLLSPKEV